MQRSINFNLTQDDQKIELKKLQDRMIKKSRTEFKIKKNKPKSFNQKLEVLSDKI